MMRTPTNYFWRWIIRNWRFKKARTRLERAAWNAVRGGATARDDFGFYYRLDLEDYIDCHLFLHGSFEKEGVLVVKELVERFDCRYFIDIGANLGVFSLPLAGFAAIEKVYAFEPDPKNYERLKTNIALNRLEDKIETFKVALSAESGSAQLHISEDRKACNAFKLNRGTSSLDFNPERHTRSVNVKMERFDSMVDLIGQRIAIKIDVEGHELAALQGMAQLLGGNECFLHVEIFPHNFERVDGYLKSIGYSQLKELELGASNFVYLNVNGRSRP